MIKDNFLNSFHKFSPTQTIRDMDRKIALGRLFICRTTLGDTLFGDCPDHHLNAGENLFAVIVPSCFKYNW